MTRVDGVRPMVQRWVMAVSAGALMLACNTKCPFGHDVRDDLLDEAQAHYKFGPERAPVPVDTSRINKPGGVLPAITISTANWSGDPTKVPPNTFIFRLTSSGAFPILGLAPGENYVWRDYVRGGHRTLVVPKDRSYQMMWLRDDGDIAYYTGNSELPRLVMSTLGFATCDDKCQRGHCTSRDTLNSFSAATDGPTVHIGYP